MNNSDAPCISEEKSMKSPFIAAAVVLSASLVLGCAGQQSQPSDASNKSQESEEKESDTERRGLDRLDRLAF